VPSLPYRSPTEPEIELFLKKAQSLNQAITLRRSRGAEIFGACGQLAGQTIKGARIYEKHQEIAMEHFQAIRKPDAAAHTRFVYFVLSAAPMKKTRSTNLKPV